MAAANCADTRDDASRNIEMHVLIGDRHQSWPDGFEQLPGLEQEIRICWPAPSFMALSKGLIDQETIHGDRVDNCPEQRAPQVVGHDDDIELTSAEWRGAALLEISFDQLDARFALEVGDACQIPVDARGAKAQLQAE